MFCFSEYVYLVRLFIVELFAYIRYQRCCPKIEKMELFDTHTQKKTSRYFIFSAMEFNCGVTRVLDLLFKAATHFCRKMRQWVH